MLIYNRNDVVEYQGLSYVATRDVDSTDPVPGAANSPWQKLGAGPTHTHDKLASADDSLTLVGNANQWGPTLTMSGGAFPGDWGLNRLHFASGWGAGGHASIGSRPDDAAPGGAGIMLGNPHVPYRDLGGTSNDGAYVRYATDASGNVYYDSGAIGDCHITRRNGTDLFRVYNNGKVHAIGGSIFIGANGPEILNEGDTYFSFLWQNVRWMQLQALGYTTISSEQYKSDITDIPVGLEKVREFAPKRYRNEASDDPERERDGLIAEELHEVYPEAVSLDADGLPHGIDYGALTPVLIRAVQELSEQVDELKRELAAIKVRTRAIESRTDIEVTRAEAAISDLRVNKMDKPIEATPTA